MRRAVRLRGGIIRVRSRLFHRELSARGFAHYSHVDASFELRTRFEGHALRADVALDASGLEYHDLLGAVEISVNLAGDAYTARGDVGIDSPRRFDDDAVLLQRDLAFEAALDDDVIFAAELALEYESGPDAGLLRARLVRARGSRDFRGGSRRNFGFRFLLHRFASWLE